MKDRILKESNKWISENIVAKDYINREITRINSGNVVLIGMRRLGKTEYLKYRLSLLENKTISSKVEDIDGNSSPGESLIQSKALFIDFDNPSFITVDFKDKTSKSFGILSDDLMELLDTGRYTTLMIDEIQRRSEWSRWLKGLVDKYSNITFIATGSDAVALNAESGLDRFSILEIGPLTFKEYTKLDAPKGVQDISFIEYIDNSIFPSQNMRDSITLQYESVYERQYSTREFKIANIASVMNWIAINPGSSIKYSSLARDINEKHHISIGDEQVKRILLFLEESKMIFSLKDSHSAIRRKARTSIRYYTTNWNAYKFAGNHSSYRSLNNSTIPRAGFIYENALISSIRSSLLTKEELSNLKYYENNGLDCDFELYGKKYEIKSFDIFSKDHEKELADLIKNKSDILEAVLYEGSTKEYKTLKFINTSEFLLEKSWKQNYK